MRARSRALPLLLPPLLFACSNAVSPVADGAASDLATAPPDLRVLHDLSYPSAAVKGVVLDESGAPLPGAVVGACSATYCPIVDDGSDGSFLFPMLKLEPRIIKVGEDATKSPPWGEALAPVDLTTANVTVDVGALYVPHMTAGVMLSSLPKDTVQSVMVGDGLALTLRPADLQIPVGAEKEPLAARAVP